MILLRGFTFWHSYVCKIIVVILNQLVVISVIITETIPAPGRVYIVQVYKWKLQPFRWIELPFWIHTEQGRQKISWGDMKKLTKKYIYFKNKHIQGFFMASMVKDGHKLEHNAPKISIDIYLS